MKTGRFSKKSISKQSGVWRKLLAALLMVGCLLLPAGLVSADAATIRISLGDLPPFEKDITIGIYPVGTVKGDGTWQTFPQIHLPVTKAEEGDDAANARHDAEYEVAVQEAEALIKNMDPSYTETVDLDTGNLEFEGVGTAVYFGKVIDGPLDFSMSPFFVAAVTEIQFDMSPKWQLTTTAKVRKVWQDDENKGPGNRDNIRPQAIIVSLYQDGKPYEENGSTLIRTLNDSNNWEAEVKGLPKYADASTSRSDHLYEYTWKEVGSDLSDPAFYSSDFKVEGYTKTEALSEQPKPGNEDFAHDWVTTVTNTHDPERINLEVHKEWDDNNNQDRSRPPSSLEVTLFKSAGGKTEAAGKVTLNEANNWTDHIDGLFVKEHGEDIAYEWKEAEIKDYELTGQSAEVVTSGGVSRVRTTLTNHYDIKKTTATITKIWNDNHNQDVRRPESITLTLRKNGADFGTHTLTAKDIAGNENTWSYTWTGLDRYTDGKENDYTWAEPQIQYYTAGKPEKSGTQTTITNTHTPETKTITVIKNWDDDSDRDRVRPDQIQLRIRDNFDYDQMVTLTASGNAVSGNANQWRYVSGPLPRYKNVDGTREEIQYSIQEVDVKSAYYEAGTPSKDGNTWTITNKHEPSTTDVSVEKVWADGSDVDGLRPASVEVVLLADGSRQGDPVTLDESNNWSYRWTGLLTKNTAGEDIRYEVDELTEIDGYDRRVITGNAKDGFIITNPHTPYTGSLCIEKSVTVNRQITTGTEADGTYSFRVTGPNYDKLFPIRILNGQSERIQINDLTPGVYIITEEVPDGMTLTTSNGQSIEVEANNGDDIPVAQFNNDISVTTPTPTTPTTPTPTTPTPTGTTPTPTTPTTPPTTPPDRTTPTPIDAPPTISITGTKTWDDENNIHNTRPDAITVRLFANGTEVNATPTWTRSDSTNTWTYTFTNLPSSRTYTVREDPVPGYTGSVSGYNITNTLIPSTPRNYVTISGTKTWADSANAAGTRPGFITVRLYRNGVEVDSRNVTAGTGWTYSFASMPADDGYGNQYTYTVREDGVPGYFARVDGYNMTNLRIPTTVTNNNTPGNGTGYPPFGTMNEESLEDLVDIFDYDTPLWGGLLGTGDTMPKYPFIFAGIGVAALLILILFGRKKKERGDAA